MEELFQTATLFRAKVVKRPSVFIKSPYVADIQLLNENDEIIDEHGTVSIDKTYLAHSPSLGCCGLADACAYVMVSKSTNPKAKTDYVIELSCFNEIKKDIKDALMGYPLSKHYNPKRNLRIHALIFMG